MSVVLPLPLQARRLLASRADIWGTDGYVFGKGSNPVGTFPLHDAASRTRTTAGKWTTHDLRRNYITIADQLVGPTIARRLVHHADRPGDVHAGYLVLDVERLRHYAQLVANKVFEPRGKIISIDQRHLRSIA